jgi:hypothetical protein
MYRPFTLWLLVFSLLFLALGGLVGGIGMLADASGRSLGMDEALPLLPVPDYTLPGLFLLLVMGLMPLLLSYGLLARPGWGRAPPRWSGHHWAWIACTARATASVTGTLALGLLLAVWLVVQGLLIGFRWPIQYVTAVNGILIIVLALLPEVRRAYAD